MSLPQLLFWTMYRPPCTLVEPNLSQTVALAGGLVVVDGVDGVPGRVVVVDRGGRGPPGFVHAPAKAAVTAMIVAAASHEGRTSRCIGSSPVDVRQRQGGRRSGGAYAVVSSPRNETA
jgi:hypothetical protein